MSILRKLKSFLGADDAGDDAERDVTVTVEHDPENEAAVKGADVTEPESDADGAIEADAEAADEPAATGDEAASSTADETPDETPDAVEIDDAEESVETADDADAESPGTERDADAESSEAERDVDEEATGDPVDVLSGIGQAYARRLGDAGVDTVADLAAADASDLSEATEIAEGRIQGWIDQAAEY